MRICFCKAVHSFSIPFILILFVDKTLPISPHTSVLKGMITGLKKIIHCD